jgi:hypothetical protein
MIQWELGKDNLGGVITGMVMMVCIIWRLA